MANNYFQFKQFRIAQERCAMKVCTDACIQGALAAASSAVRKSRVVLDIGAGTGLLSLMLAQENSFRIQDAVEINKNAFEQAVENCKTSVFKNNIRLVNEDIRVYYPSYLYDFIISNPPFYEKDLQSPSGSKKQAMHSSHLNYEELLACINRLLSPDGIFCLMTPYQVCQKLIKKAELQSFYPFQIYHIKHRKEKPFFRSIFFFQRQQMVLKQEELIIKENSNIYTSDFKNLLKSYYLKL